MLSTICLNTDLNLIDHHILRSHVLLRWVSSQSHSLMDTHRINHFNLKYLQRVSYKLIADIACLSNSSHRASDSIKYQINEHRLNTHNISERNRKKMNSQVTLHYNENLKKIVSATHQTEG